MKLAGVYYTKCKDGSDSYRASLTHKGKHISIGSFGTPEAANAAYCEAKRVLGSSCAIADYCPSDTIPFDKYVILINLRDNGIYFTNPIYLGVKMFFYYFNQDTVLKFDMDDLFYFSQRKISKRDNHFFVADYGMQINITARFGVKQYGVEGKDYRFLNGDNLDFRRSNIEILNTYHGVSEKTTKTKTLYVAKIHIKGNYIIGKYDTPIEAAIAYNKAVDQLKAIGLKKDYLTNDLFDISPKAYAEIYSGLVFSENFRQFLMQTTPS